MKRQSANAAILISVGLFVIAGTFILSRLVHVSDMVKGLLMGIGIGLMALFFIARKKQKAQTH
ncbi:MAG: hypothetical protein J0I41_01335 [Filimonas sp.]|nr:hypothetical protein [Filimonas sp.]